MAVYIALLGLFVKYAHSGNSYVNPLFAEPIYYELLEEGFRDACWVENFWTEDKCTGRGFCYTDMKNEQNGTWIKTPMADWKCQCFYGFTGTQCRECHLCDVCETIDCGDYGMCIFNSTRTGGTCTCETGWTKETLDYINEDNGLPYETCEEETPADACEGVICGGHGSCEPISETEWQAKQPWQSIKDQGKRRTAVMSDQPYECACDNGWGGQYCGEQLAPKGKMIRECNPTFLLDMFTRLMEYGAGAKECSYIKPIIYSDAKESIMSEYVYPYCICRDLWIQTDEMYDEYLNMLNTCVLDARDDTPFFELAESYCPDCSPLQDEVMEDVLTAMSDECYHFVYEREDMPLYWRSIWKCRCLESLGEESTVETIVTCPFTNHASNNDFISYKKCSAHEICDWPAMYDFFENEFSMIDLGGAEVCKDMMYEFTWTTPGEQRFEEMEDTFCPCLTALQAYANPEILECIPVTFHQITAAETYRKICYDSQGIETVDTRECLNIIGWNLIESGVQNFTAATSCYSLMDLTDMYFELTDHHLNLMCNCLVPLFDYFSYPQDTYFMEALECIPDVFTFSISQCDAWTRPFDIDFPLTYTRRAEHKRYKPPDEIPSWRTPLEELEPSLPLHPLPIARRREDSSTEHTAAETLEIATIIEIPLVLLLAINAWFLNKRKKSSLQYDKADI